MKKKNELSPKCSKNMPWNFIFHGFLSKILPQINPARSGFALLQQEQTVNTTVHLYFYKMPEDLRELYQKFANQYPDRFHVQENFEDFKFCSLWLWNVERPDWNVQELLPSTAKIESVMLGVLFAGCDGDNTYYPPCRFLRKLWKYNIQLKI